MTRVLWSLYRFLCVGCFCKEGNCLLLFFNECNFGPKSHCNDSQDEKPNTVVIYAQMLRPLGMNKSKMEDQISAMRALQSHRAGVGVPSGTHGSCVHVSKPQGGNSNHVAIVKRMGPLRLIFDPLESNRKWRSWNVTPNHESSQNQTSWSETIKIHQVSY